MDISAYQHMNIRMSTRGKRPLRNLTPNDKVRAIQRIHNGETKASVSRDIGVPESTLRGWCKNEQKLRFMCRQLSAAPDQLPLSMLENQPVEKRSKFDTHHRLMSHKLMTSINGFEELAGYSRLPFTGATDFIDTTTHSNNIDRHLSANSVLEKMALTEFMKKKNNMPLMETDSRHVKTGVAIDAATASTPSSSTPDSDSMDYSHLLLMQNHLSLLSLLNPSFLTMSGLSVVGTTNLIGSNSVTPKSGDNKIKVPLRTSNLIEESSEQCTRNNVALSVKNWAKEPSNGGSDINGKSDNYSVSVSDSNNNDIVKILRQKALLYAPITEAGIVPGLSLLKAPGNVHLLDAISNIDPENSNNTALVEWCKVFNASLNFLALTAAAAALQSPTPTPTLTPTPTTTPTTAPSNLPFVNEDNDNSPNVTKTEEAISPLPGENILYTHLIKARRMGTTPAQSSDVSNDSYYESEPEDLSVRSTTSKISSLDNSRSQSPAKSTSSSSSVHSNMDA